ncbi:MAG: hypothetical protein GIX03_02425 [Candidatus Eremiobacteraeota bacterium]|nr:hypothetical protein [Candidatus Eremiobacteraeota bacterium]MBC5805698.1 hypothetical protein [Candidatus Eremiobacteraeota bacterium]MBC5825312.1 hypothetical protein [Candidatus Eremiobacteraeota bacterium]
MPQELYTQRLLFAAICTVAMVSGCAHLQVGPSPPASPTPTATATNSPGICNTTQAPNTTLVTAMSSSITATTDPTYGTINGYTDAAGGSQTASVINAKTTDVIQFVNVDSNSINHSAVGFPNAKAFPSVPYTFQSASQTPQGTAISTSQTWSTGLIASQGGSGCYSQAFTVPSTGTYYFGDYNYYNLTNMRDVIVVTQ